MDERESFIESLILWHKELTLHHAAYRSVAVDFAARLGLDADVAFLAALRDPRVVAASGQKAVVLDRLKEQAMSKDRRTSHHDLHRVLSPSFRPNNRLGGSNSS
jgi:hypothetical protein